MSSSAPEPNPALVARWMSRLAELEATNPTGDPGAIRCSVRGSDGTVCGRGRVHVGPGMLACPSCDAGYQAAAS